MYNKELFEKIVDATCTFKELESFIIDIDKQEYDLDNAFEKYYNVDKILNVINIYENKKIKYRYLSYWMNAYNWIIRSGFKNDFENKKITFKDVIIFEISDWLDSLSFFNESDDWFYLNEYKNAFVVLDKIYKNLSDWKCVFGYDCEYEHNDGNIVFFTINHNTKEFVKITGYIYDISNNFNIEQMESKEIEEEIKRLQKLGYNEIKYGQFDDFKE